MHSLCFRFQDCIYWHIMTEYIFRTASRWHILIAEKTFKNDCTINIEKISSNGLYDLLFYYSGATGFGSSTISVYVWINMHFEITGCSSEDLSKVVFCFHIDSTSSLRIPFSLRLF